MFLVITCVSGYNLSNPVITLHMSMSKISRNSDIVSQYAQWAS